MSKYILVSDTDNNQQLVYQDTGIKIVPRFKIGTKVKLTNKYLIPLLKKYVFALDDLDVIYHIEEPEPVHDIMTHMTTLLGTFEVVNYDYYDTDGLIYNVKSKYNDCSLHLFDNQLENANMYWHLEGVFNILFSNLFSRLSNYKYMDHYLSDKEMSEANTLLTIIKKLINNDSVLKHDYGIYFNMGAVTKEGLYARCNGIYHDILDQFREGKNSFDVGCKIICTYHDLESLDKSADIRFVGISNGISSCTDDYMIIRSRMIQELMQTGGTVIASFSYEGGINSNHIIVKINGFEDYGLKICNPEKYCIVRR